MGRGRFFIGWLVATVLIRRANYGIEPAKAWQVCFFFLYGFPKLPVPQVDLDRGGFHYR
jgi:hypothetical protein